VKFELTEHMRNTVDTHLDPEIAEQTDV